MLAASKVCLSYDCLIYRSYYAPGMALTQDEPGHLLECRATWLLFKACKRTFRAGLTSSAKAAAVRRSINGGEGPPLRSPL